MSYGKKNTGGHGVTVFIVLIMMAVACFGGFAYIFTTTKNGGTVDDTIVSISKIIVLLGIFFLVMAFGHVLPSIVNGKKSKGGTQVTDSNDMFNEANMRRALEKNIPAGETLIAGIHAVANESSVHSAFEKCVLVEDMILPSETRETLTVSKTKYSTYDLYIGITQHYFVVADCEKYRYYYEFDKYTVKDEEEIKMVTEAISIKDIGKCFSLDEIQSCNVKNGMAGSLKCNITLKNGGYFKLMLPAKGGLGGGMPNHKEYRDRIVECLSSCTNSK